MVEPMIVAQLSVADQMSIGTVSSKVGLVIPSQKAYSENLHMYSDAFNPPRALVRMMPHIPALGYLVRFIFKRVKYS